MRHPDESPTGGPTGALEQQLVAALHRRAALAPDAEQVLRAADAAGTLRRRRHQQVGAGVALAVAGLTAFAVPRVDDVLRAVHPDASWIAGRPDSPPASAAPAPAASPEPVPWTLPADDEALESWAAPAVAPTYDAEDEAAFFAAGLTYDDALELARLWGRPEEPGYAKAVAGARLRADEALPVLSRRMPGEVLPQTAWAAFTEGGLDVDEALQLAQLWGSPSGFQAAQRAGELLLTGQALPVTTASPASDETAFTTFTGAGYDYDDATALAALWGLAGPDQAKVAGGSNLLAGQGLPVQP